MIADIPTDAITVLASTEIHDGWVAALTSSGHIVNRWDPITESDKYEATEALILQFLKSHQEQGFEGESD